MLDYTKVQEILDERGLSRAELWRLMGGKGRSSHLSKILNGDVKNVTFQVVENIARALDLPIHLVVTEEINEIGLNKIRDALDDKDRSLFFELLFERKEDPENPFDIDIGTAEILYLGETSPEKPVLPDYSGKGVPSIEDKVYFYTSDIYGKNIYCASVKDRDLEPYIEYGSIVMFHSNAKFEPGKLHLVRLKNGKELVRVVHDQGDLYLLVAPGNSLPISIKKTEVQFMHGVTNIVIGQRVVTD